ncbi:MAG: SAM-dependent DNA methyltransferase [Leptospiraceae bacterium]|nr:SAM-dependent DNA methyltransferase [Leptospiraceae bacterium]
MENTENLASEIWSVADLLRGDFKQSQYGRIILPFTLLRRLECVLAKTKEKVVKKHKEVEDKSEEIQEKLLLKEAKLPFYNTSEMDLTRLGETQVLQNLTSYINSFSPKAVEIFEYFNFTEFLNQLSASNLLYKVAKKFATMNLDTNRISNYEMGLVFEELIRRFAESSNETAGEHFTPRDIIQLTTLLLFIEEERELSKPGVIITVYDPTAGTGGFLSSSSEYIEKMNPHAKVVVFGQELNPESYAICKGDMLIKGQDVNNIKLGNTLSHDLLYNIKASYMLSNPPFGVEWKKVFDEVDKEHKEKGFNGRFGPGLPRVSDGSLLFLLHLIAKMRKPEEGGSKIGIILNGSPLFTGGAGSGESEIRRYILENDLLEGIVALPTDMFYNTGIATYIWILNNRKPDNKKNRVILVNGTGYFSKMRKSLGSKRNYLTDSDIEKLTKIFSNFKKAKDSKVFSTRDFGYRRITVERPLRLSIQFSDEKVETLRFLPKFRELSEWLYSKYSERVYKEPEKLKAELEEYLKQNEIKLKQVQIKEFLSKSNWEAQKELMDKAILLQKIFGKKQYDDFNSFKELFEKAISENELKLDAKEKKQIIDAVSYKNPEAERVIDKKEKKRSTHKEIFGFFPEGEEVITYVVDSELRDSENVPLKENVEAYFLREVKPHVPDAWINEKKVDEKDGGIGIVGYEIPFNRHFYEYKPPRELSEIDKDLEKVTKEILGMLA